MRASSPPESYVGPSIADSCLLSELATHQAGELKGMWNMCLSVLHQNQSRAKVHKINKVLSPSYEPADNPHYSWAPAMLLGRGVRPAATDRLWWLVQISPPWYWLMSHCVNYRAEMLTVHTLTQWDLRSGLRAAQDFPESGVCDLSLCSSHQPVIYFLVLWHHC